MPGREKVSLGQVRGMQAGKKQKRRHKARRGTGSRSLWRDLRSEVRVRRREESQGQTRDARGAQHSAQPRGREKAGQWPSDPALRLHPQDIRSAGAPGGALWSLRGRLGDGQEGSRDILSCGVAQDGAGHLGPKGGNDDSLGVELARALSLRVQGTARSNSSLVTHLLDPRGELK